MKYRHVGYNFPNRVKLPQLTKCIGVKKETYTPPKNERAKTTPKSWGCSLASDLTSFLGGFFLGGFRSS